MKTFTCISILLVAVNASLLEEADFQFRSFKTKYGKSYRNPAEEATRFAIFKDNLKAIEEHNALYQQGKTTWEKGITKFTDWTDAEYKSMLNLQKVSLPKITEAKELKLSSKVAIPDAIDYREEGQVTEVKDQGDDCAASWAFSVAGSIEAAFKRKTGNLVSLSAQELVDCTYEVGNWGCEGGQLRETMPYAEWHGLQSEESYPYSGELEECKLNETAIVTKIDSFKYFFNNQYQLEQVVGSIGPVSASVIADGIKDYKSGIYGPDGCNDFTYVDDANLGVLIVGYGSSNGTNYWIVKSCYGSDWGEDGYIRMLKKGNYYSCGLYRENVYPIIY